MDLTNKQKEEIKGLYFKNTDISKISLLTGIDTAEIRNFFKTEKICKERQEYFRQTIISGLKQKKLASEVANELNCTTRQLSKIAENLQVETYFKKNAKERREKIVLEEFEKNNFTIIEMCKKLNYSYSNVQKIYKKYRLSEKRQPNYPFKVLNKQKLQILLNEIQAGKLTLNELGRKYGISTQRISVIKKNSQKS